VKRNSIEYFNTIFKPLFLCFQETGNGTNEARNPCKVTLPNYKYFLKRMVYIYIPTKKHSLQVRYAFSEVFTWLQNHMNHLSILLGDFNMSTSDLQDKLSNSNLDNWLILPINGSPISWTRGRFSLDIDHALVNSSMLDWIKYQVLILLIILLYRIINLS